MHTLLLLSSLLVVLLGGMLTLGTVHRLHGWARRREAQVVVLAAPVVSLSIGIGGVYHFIGRTCFLGAPSWDYWLLLGLPFSMGLVALTGLGLCMVRLMLLTQVMAWRSTTVDHHLQATVTALATSLGAAFTQVRLCSSDRPLALTCGLRRPTIFLSTWMLAHLDRQELEAVLAHEIGHVVRRDYLLVALATTLRDAFCYLPTSWAAYRSIRRDAELACDDLAIAVTHHPLALASALAKVWQYATADPAYADAQALSGTGTGIEGRITRLLTMTTSTCNVASTRPTTRGIGAVALGALLMIEAVNVAVMLASMGCGPIAPLGRLF